MRSLNIISVFVHIYVHYCVYMIVHTYVCFCVHYCVYRIVHLCMLLCVQHGTLCTQCVQQCVQKTKTKQLPPPKVRGKRGIMSEKEPEDRKSSQRATERRRKTKGKRTDKGKNYSENKESRTKVSGTSTVTQRTVQTWDC